MQNNLPSLSFYEWTRTLPRAAWAWEFLRRNEKFEPYIRGQQHGYDIEHRPPNLTVVKVNHPLAAAHALYVLPPYPDPLDDVRLAEPLWPPRLYPAVLPVVALGDGASPLPLSTFDCRVVVCTYADGGEYVLFKKDQYWLQLCVHSGSILSADRLIPDLESPAAYSATRLRSAKQLAHVISNRCLDPAFQPPYAGNDRLLAVLRAFDADRLGASHRDIAIAFYGEQRVADEWRRQYGGMRHRISRAISRGKDLVAGRYAELLRD